MGYVILMFIAGAGFLASIGCQVLSWLGIDPPGGQAVFLLHFGIFVVWIPLVTFSNRTMPKGSRNNMDHLLAELPAWVNKAFKGLYIFGILNFVYFMYCGFIHPKHQAALPLEKPNYDLPFYLELRGFSGMWMVFYGYATIGIAALARLSRKRKQELPDVSIL